MNARTLVWKWMPVIAWMVLIFAASSDAMSAEHTSRFIEPFLHWLRPDISPATVAVVHALVRKAAHVTEYAILAVLLFRALKRPVGLPLLQMATAVVIAGSYAALDEFHQSFVPTRTASPRDVLIDICGAVFGVLLYRSFHGRSDVAKSPARVVA